jgi:hypothetical protein
MPFRKLPIMPIIGGKEIIISSLSAGDFCMPGTPDRTA